LEAPVVRLCQAAFQELQLFTLAVVVVVRD
jgi:hypothetical protein